MNSVRSLRPYAVVAPAVLATLLLGACGGSSGTAAGGSTPTGAPTSRAASGQGGNRPPGVFGLVAAISGKTLQVQSTSDQTAVTYTASTKFTATVATTKSAVKVGSCVVVREAGAGGGSTPGATPTARPTQSSTVAAGTVTITAPVNGQCSIAGAFGGFGGGGGRFGGGAGGNPTSGNGQGNGQGAGGGQPAGVPSGAPSGGRGGFGGGFGAMTIGKVTALSGSGFTVSAETFAGRPGGNASGGATPSGTPTFSTRTVTVTTSSGTTYTTTKSASSSALAVGKCVSARGAADSTGSVTATSIAVTPAANGMCSLRGA